MMRKVTAKVKGAKVELVMDCQSSTKDKEFIAKKYGVRAAQVIVIKKEAP